MLFGSSLLLGTLFAAGFVLFVSMHPFSFAVAVQIQEETNDVVQAHGGTHPGEVLVQQPNQNEGTQNTHTPHRTEGDEEGTAGVTGTFERTGVDHCIHLRNLDERQDLQQLAAQFDDGRVGSEQGNDAVGQEEKHTAHKEHDASAHQTGDADIAARLLLIAGAQRLTDQGGRCRTKGKSGHKAQRFCLTCQRVGSQRNGTQSGNDTGGDNKGAGHGETLKHDRQADMENLPQCITAGTEALFQGDAHWTGALGKTDGKQRHRTHHLGKGGRKRSAGDAHTGSPHREGMTEHGDLARSVNQQEVANHVGQVDSDVNNHWGLGIPEPSVDCCQDHHQPAEQHGEGDDADVALCVIQDFGSSAHPNRNLTGQGKAKRRKRDAQRKYNNNRLPNEQPCIVIFLRTHSTGNHGGKSDAQSQNDRVNQVDWVLADGDRSGSICSQRADHRGINRLNQRYQNLLDKNRPRQRDDDGDGITGWVGDRNDAMLHKIPP